MTITTLGTGACLLSQQQLIDQYFMEHRAQILNVAAFLDRLDRSMDKNGEDDFRLIALKRSLHELTSADGERVERIQMLLSDRDTTLLDTLDRKAAYGASIRGSEEQ